MKKINISPVDVIFANGSYPIEFLFFYKYKLNTKNIRLALKKLSSDFWPAFGKYHSGAIHSTTYSEQDCFDEEIIDHEFNSNESDENLYKTYCTSIPSDLEKLFFLTILQYKNGTVLIAKLNHLAGDGYSYFYLLSTLANLTRSNYLPLKKSLMQAFYKPRHQRTILQDFQFTEKPPIPLQLDENLTIRCEEIPKAEVRNRIKNISEHVNQKVSTNDILTAIVIKNLFTMQPNTFGIDFVVTIPIDVRRYIREYGPKYFGNGIMIHQHLFKSEEIEKSNVDELAIHIRKSMPIVTKESYTAYLEKIEALIASKQSDKLIPYDPARGCLVTNLSKLPADKLDFGSGNPDLIFLLTIGKNSTAILADKDNFILRLSY